MQKKYDIPKIIHMNHLLQYILKVRKVDLLIWAVVLVLSVILGAVKINRDINELKAMPDEKEKKVKISAESMGNMKSIADLEEQILQMQEYNDHSILMKINAQEKKGRYLYVIFEGMDAGNLAQVRKDYITLMGDKEALYDMLNAHFGEEVSYNYYNEIITVEQPDVMGLGIRIYHYDESRLDEMCDVIMEYMQEICQIAKSQNILYDLSSYSVNLNDVDTNLLNTQNNKINTLATYQDAFNARLAVLTEDEKEYYELYKTQKNNPSYVEGEPIIKMVSVDKSKAVFSKRLLLKYILFALIAEYVLRCILLFSYYVFNGRLMNADNLEDMFEIRYLGKVSREGSEPKKVADMLKQILYHKLANKETILILTNRENDLKDEMKKAIEESFDEINIATIWQDMDKEEEEILKSINKADAVLVVEEECKSKLQGIAKKKDMCRLCGVEIVGAIVR